MLTMMEQYQLDDPDDPSWRSHSQLLEYMKNLEPGIDPSFFNLWQQIASYDLYVAGALGEVVKQN